MKAVREKFYMKCSKLWVRNMDPEKSRSIETSWRWLPRIPWTDKVTIENVLKRENETRALDVSLIRRINSFVCHLFRHSDWCATLLFGEARMWKKQKENQEYNLCTILNTLFPSKLLAKGRKRLEDAYVTHQPGDWIEEADYKEDDGS